MRNLVIAERNMDDACRGIRHATREYVPWIRGGLSLAFGVAAVCTDGHTSVALASASGLTGAFALHAVIDDYKFWGPSVKRFFEAKSILTELRDSGTAPRREP